MSGRIGSEVVSAGREGLEQCWSCVEGSIACSDSGTEDDFGGIRLIHSLRRN